MNMDYLSVAEEKISNTPVLVNLISYRTRQLNGGARPMVKRDHPEMDNHDIVLKEIAEGLLTAEMVNKIEETEVSELDFDASILL
ncbi:MAG TPA: DNA-directed RNA polymerase subunit omega [Pontiella sp.]